MKAGVPNIQMYFTEACELAVLRTRTSGEEAQLVVEIPVDALLTGAKAEAEQRLGEAILKHLAVLYPRVLTSYVQQNRDTDLEHDLVHDLIHLSIKRKTSSYVNTMDTLLANGSVNSTQVAEFRNNSWPDIRRHLATFPAT